MILPPFPSSGLLSAGTRKKLKEVATTCARSYSSHSRLARRFTAITVDGDIAGKPLL
jgi:hypothetical protein